MPFYTVHHATVLSDEQKDKLAEAITQIHSSFFETPRLFVNVIFQDLSKATIYIAGRRKLSDMISLQTRTGPSRTQEHFEQLIHKLREAWSDAVGSRIDRVIIAGGFVAGMEAGVMLPQAGGDREWLATNWKGFKERAAAGDEEIQGLIADIESRKQQ